MTKFIAVTIVLALLSLMSLQLVKNVRYKIKPDWKSASFSLLQFLACMIVVSDLWLGGDISVRLMADFSISMIPMMMLSGSLWKSRKVKSFTAAFVIVEVLAVLYYILCIAGVTDVADDTFFVVLASFAVVLQSVFFIVAMSARIFDIRTLMKNSTVWAHLCLIAEAVTSLCVLCELLIFYAICALTGSMTGLPAALTAALFGLSLLAPCFRICFDSAFVIMHKHERVIIESMKISHMEIINSGRRIDDMYKEIYDRVLLYFEKEKPFLNSELTINDIVKVVFTNKLYISKAISHYTGRNFCQFVNYYRVTHSLSVFREQPDLKVSELANMCGFNSVVSFSTAFRLFMGETPSEWCRKERSSILKKKK